MLGVREGQAICEPAAGSGGMLVATARDMRSRGLDPTTCSWLINDLDPVAVALAGVNAVVHGFGQNVQLRCGNGLTLGTDLPH
jgi:type I restriction enzyme M protein